MDNKQPNNEKNTRGGARPGAGRPKMVEPRKAHSFSCTDTEAAMIKKLLLFLRTYPELIDGYCKRLLAKDTDKEASKVPSLQWLESEEESEANQKTVADKKTTTDFQWLESEAEEKASSKEISERVSRSTDAIARGIAEMLIK